MKNQDFEYLEDLSEEYGLELTDEKIKKLLDIGITAMNAWKNMDSILPSRQEIEALGHDFEEWQKLKEEYDLYPKDIRYLLDNGFTAEVLDAKGFNPYELANEYGHISYGICVFIAECGYKYQPRNGNPIETEEEMIELKNRIEEKWGYEMTENDCNIILDLGLCADDVNFSEDYSHRYNPRIYGSVRHWAEDPYVQLLPPTPTNGLLDSLAPGETITF